MKKLVLTCIVVLSVLSFFGCQKESLTVQEIDALFGSSFENSGLHRGEDQVFLGKEPVYCMKGAFADRGMFVYISKENNINPMESSDAEIMQEETLKISGHEVVIKAVKSEIIETEEGMYVPYFLVEIQTEEGYFKYRINADNSNMYEDDQMLKKADKDFVKILLGETLGLFEVQSGVYEISLIGENGYDDSYTVYFDMPGPNNTLCLDNLNLEDFNGFEKGDVVYIKFYESGQLCSVDRPDRCSPVYDLLFIAQSTGLYEEGYTLSELIGFEPVQVEVTVPTEEFDETGIVYDTYIFESETEIKDFLAKMDEITVYKDCVEDYGAGGEVYIMEFTSENGDTVVVKDHFNVDVTYSKPALFGAKEITFGVHRTKEDSRQYANLLDEMFRK